MFGQEQGAQTTLTRNSDVIRWILHMLRRPIDVLRRRIRIKTTPDDFRYSQSDLSRASRGLKKAAPNIMGGRSRFFVDAQSSSTSWANTLLSAQPPRQCLVSWGPFDTAVFAVAVLMVPGSLPRANSEQGTEQSAPARADGLAFLFGMRQTTPRAGNSLPSVTYDLVGIARCVVL